MNNADFWPFKVCPFKLVTVHCHYYFRLHGVSPALSTFRHEHLLPGDDIAVKMLIHWLEPPSWNRAIPTYGLATVSLHNIYVEDRYTTQTVLKPSGRFYKWLAGFKTGWPNLIHYVHPRPLQNRTVSPAACSIDRSADRPALKPSAIVHHRSCTK